MRKNSLQFTAYSLQKKTVLLVIVIGCWLLAAFLGGCAKREIKNIDSKGTNIICFGDSITHGYGVNRGEDYPSALAELIGKPVLNMGVDGQISAGGLERIKADVLDREPLLVIIEFGGNDFLSKVPREDTVRNIKEMVRNIHKSKAMAAIADVSAGMFLADYRRDLSALAKEEGVIFIPGILSGIITNPSMKSDFFHPNGSGYKLIARRVSGVIKPYLEKNTRLRNSKK